MIRQAIVTKYVAPTNTRGGRVKATSGGGLSVTIGWDHGLDVAENHLAGAVALMKKHGWDQQNDLVQGGLKDGYAFVMVPKNRKTNPIDEDAGIHIDIGSHNQNPAPRIGAAKPGRKSQVTGEKPSMRLVQRRKKNTRPGYYPNPAPAKGLRYRVSVKIPGKAGWFAIAMFVEEDEAKKYAKKTAEHHPSWSVKVESE